MGSMREDFENAFEETDGADETFAEHEQEILSSEPEETEAVEDAPAAEVEVEAPEPETEEAEPEIEAVEANADEGDADEKPSHPNDSMKAPENWSLNDRSNWSKIPPDMQKVVTAREKEFADFKAEAAGFEQAHDFINSLQQNYAPILAAEGVNAPQAIKGLFEKVSQLRMGSPQQKAQAVATIISDYGIDIGALDSVLVGKPVQESQQSEVQRLVQEQLAPMQNMMQQQQQQVQQQVQQRTQQATDEVTQFAQGAEFLNDVRNDMADLLDMADKRGVSMSLQQVYDKACAIHPEISNIIAERTRSADLMTAQTTLAAKKAASTSLSGKQHGIPSVNTANMSIRDSIAAAWEGEA